MHRLIYASEQHQAKLLYIHDNLKLLFLDTEYSKQFKLRAEKPYCFKIHHNSGEFLIDSSYYIGVDWIIKDKAALYVEPKLNDEELEIDFLSMLIEALEATENFNHLNDLFDINCNESWIKIPQKKDLLSPILIVQFLKILQHIVKKGLKKSYYTVQTNLNNKVKGKILVGKQIRENIFKNRLTNTVCEYQEYGINFKENQFLKTVLTFVKTYVYKLNTCFSTIQRNNLVSIINFCEAPFQSVDELHDKHREIKLSKNAFYKDYDEAIRIGGFILKRFSYNISKVSENTSMIPPFWIDMSKLFELYVFKKLKQIFPAYDAVSYHDRFMGGKETDILLKEQGYETVIDCKYKPQYKDNSPSLEDKRQLAGYTRLKSVYDRLKIPYNGVIKGLIIYSHQDSPDNLDKETLFNTEIKEYIDFYKAGISLPQIS